MLWVDNTTKGATPIADRLVANTLRLQGLVQSVPAAGGPDRQRRQGSARRGRGLQDHRRGGDGTRTPTCGTSRRTSTAPRPRPRRSNRSSREKDPELADEITAAFTEVDAALALRAGIRLRPLHAAERDRHEGAVGVDRRARGADQQVAPRICGEPRRRRISRRRLLGRRRRGRRCRAGGAIAHAATATTADATPVGSTGLTRRGSRRRSRTTCTSRLRPDDASRRRRGPLMRQWTAAAALMAAAVPGQDREQRVAPPDRHRRGRRPAAVAADGDLRLRAVAVLRPVRPRSRSGREELAPLPHFAGRRPRPGTRTATSACRPAPTTRRSPSTRSATWPGSASAPSACAGRSSASAGPRRPRRPGDAAQPDGLQGRHRATSRPTRRDAGERTSGSAAGDGPAWMAGGTYLVAARIRMRIETWDRTRSASRRRLRPHKGSGAPLGGAAELDRVDLDAKVPDGRHDPPTRTSALARRASERRADPPPRLHLHRRHRRPRQLDAGLFFLAFQRDPREQFVPIQRRLGLHDALNEYIQHTSAASAPCRRAPRADYLARRCSPDPAERRLGCELLVHQARESLVRPQQLEAARALEPATEVGEDPRPACAGRTRRRRCPRPLELRRHPGHPLQAGARRGRGSAPGRARPGRRAWRSASASIADTRQRLPLIARHGRAPAPARPRPAARG